MPDISWCIFGSARHDNLFDTLYSLVALLKSGEWEAYRQIFIGAMLLVEGTHERLTLRLNTSCLKGLLLLAL